MITTRTVPRAVEDIVVDAEDDVVGGDDLEVATGPRVADEGFVAALAL